MDALGNYEDVAVLPDQARHAADNKLYVTFYLRPIKNEFKTSLEGRPIFDEIEFIRIMIPGNVKDVVDTMVNEEFKQRWPDKYDRFKKNLSQANSGTPLEHWPLMTVGRVAELKAMNIQTVEQLADLPDSVATSIMGFHDLRRRAQAFIEAATEGAAASKLAAELAERDDKIGAMESTVADLTAKLEKLLAAQAQPKIAVASK